MDADTAATVARQALTNGINLETNSQRLALADEGAMAVKTALTNQVYAETYAAGAALKNLDNLGRLPGVSQDDHWQVTSDMVDSVVSNRALAIEFPASRTFRLVKTNETSTNNYTFVKQTKDAEWKLQKAWQTDSKGQIIQEWPVK